MNWLHLRAFFWLRWRLRVNQIKRAGTFSLVVSAIFAILTVFASGAAFVVALTAGKYIFADVSAPVLMLVWDGAIAGFLFFWLVGLLAELQRAEVLSIEKFLHLPIPLTGVFLINYAGSFFSLSIAVFGSAMLGLSIALVRAKGPAMLWLFPMVAALFLMVTAITYQFQGWLAALMSNKRRRRTVITFISLAFVLVLQLPNIINMSRPWNSRQNGTSAREMRQELRQLDQALASGTIDPEQYQRESAAVRQKYRLRREELTRTQLETAERIAKLVNTFVPPGWVAYGAMMAAQGQLWPAASVTLGLMLITSASLWRSYRTTMRLYSGQVTGAKPSPAAMEKVAKLSRVSSSTRSPVIEWQLPWLSEQASAIATASFRSLTRAPEAKMLLLTSIIMVVIFGSMTLRRTSEPPEFTRLLMAAGAVAMVLFSMGQLSGNIFGFDRTAFRAFVLSPVSRKDILLGKNAGLAPLVFVLGAVVVGIVAIVYPVRADHLLAAFLQIIPMYLVYCVIANLLSIVAPMPVAAGSLKPVRPKGVTVLLHIIFVFVVPVTLSLTLVPLGLEFLLDWWGWHSPFPVYLLAALLECAVIVSVYKVILQWEGRLLQERELRILETVTSKVE
jgi:ABC-2 type transport system permease protein